MRSVLRDLARVMTFAFVVLRAGAWANVYYVAKSGDDANTCTQAQNVTTPKLTINAALGCVGKGAGVGAGHSVIVKEGAYAEYFLRTIPGGTSWAAPFTLMASPGESVTLNPFNPDNRIITLADVEYVIIEGFRLDSSGAAFEPIKIDYLASNGMPVPGSASNHIRLKNLEIISPIDYGITVTGEGTDNEFIGLKIRDCGLRNANTNAEGAVGIAIASSRNLVEGCEIHGCSAGGVQVYGPASKPSQNVIRNNTFYDFTVARDNGTRTDHYGIRIYNGSENTVYNNVIANVAGPGVLVRSGATETRVLNNTVVGVSGASGAGISLDNTVTNTRVHNNILWLTALTPVRNLAVGTTRSHNLCADTAICEVSSAPEFVDQAMRDFRLGPNSPAVDVGLTLTEVKTDLLGITRPKGSNYDLGAYERFGTPNVPDGSGANGYRIYGLGCGCESGASVGLPVLLALAVLGSRRGEKSRNNP